MDGGPTWRGQFVEVTADGEWRFWRCLRCEKPISKPNQDGYGPECRRRRPLDWRAERRKALAEDRKVYRHHRDIPAGKPPTGKQLLLLRTLAEEQGTEMPKVETRFQASQEIKRLLETKPS